MQVFSRVMSHGFREAQVQDFGCSGVLSVCLLSAGIANWVNMSFCLDKGNLPEKNPFNGDVARRRESHRFILVSPL